MPRIFCCATKPSSLRSIEVGRPARLNLLTALIDTAACSSRRVPVLLRWFYDSICYSPGGFVEALLFECFAVISAYTAFVSATKSGHWYHRARHREACLGLPKLASRTKHAIRSLSQAWDETSQLNGTVKPFAGPEPPARPSRVLDRSVAKHALASFISLRKATNSHVRSIPHLQSGREQAWAKMELGRQF